MAGPALYAQAILDAALVAAVRSTPNYAVVPCCHHLMLLIDYHSPELMPQARRALGNVEGYL